MNLSDLLQVAEAHPKTFARFRLPGGDFVPGHAHLTEVGHVIRNFIDCGGQIGREEKIVLQTHVGNDTDHRLQSDRFARILKLGGAVVPNSALEVEVEYDCCVVSHYPLAEARANGEYLDLILQRGRTHCRARQRRLANEDAPCC